MNAPPTPSPQRPDTVWLVDASIYIFRAWFVLPDSITDRDSNPVNAVHGFIDFVRTLLENERPRRIGFAFDQSLGTSWRREIYPDQMADLLAIAGDSSDNIPGVPGIGMATAAKLLKKFDCIDNLLSRTPEIGRARLRGAKRLQRLVEEHRDTIVLSRRLTAIACDIDETAVTAPLERGAVDDAALDALLERLRMPPSQREAWRRLATETNLR